MSVSKYGLHTWKMFDVLDQYLKTPSHYYKNDSRSFQIIPNTNPRITISPMNISPNDHLIESNSPNLNPPNDVFVEKKSPTNFPKI